MARPYEALETLRTELDVMSARMQVDDESMGNLRKLYSLIWIEACYDPNNDESKKFAQKCWPHIMALNEKLKFKR